MEIALIGLPQSGKTTIFKALAGDSNTVPTQKSGSVFEPATQMVQVPDPRVDRLSQMYSPQKTIHTTIKITDIPGFQKKDLKSEKIVSAIEHYIGTVDALVNVVNMFDNPDQAVQAVTDIEFDCIMRDMAKVEARLERIEHSHKKVTGKQREYLEEEQAVLKECLDILNREHPLRVHSFSSEQMKILSGFQFWSLKPMLILFNCCEETFKQPLPLKELESILSFPDTVYMKLIGQLEMEISELSPDEKQDFLAAYGLEEPGREKVIQKLYDLLALNSFFTVKKDEVRAWTIARGTKAKEAAGKIHSDMEEGFIRAEVISYEDLIHYGSEHEVKKNGKCRFEGKEYVVRDGDIISFLFNR